MHNTPPSLLAPPTPSLMPKHLEDRLRELRAKSEGTGCTQLEENEYLLLRRLTLAFEQGAPMHQTRVAYDKRTLNQLQDLEDDARELRERAEYLQGIRKDPPVPRKQVYVLRVTRPKP